MDKEKKTLLDRALTTEVTRINELHVGDEEVELLIAWLDNKITGKQAAIVIGCSEQNVKGRMARWLKLAYKKGLVEVILKK